MEKSLEHSLCFGVYYHSQSAQHVAQAPPPSVQQVGFARVVTDYATFAYLSDVFVAEAHRGKALGKWLLECIMEYAELQDLRRWMLATADAQGLYGKYGFTSIRQPKLLMKRHNPKMYEKGNNS